MAPVYRKWAGREVLLSGETLLEEVRRLGKEGAGVVQRRRLEGMPEEHLALACHAQSR